MYEKKKLTENNISDVIKDIRNSKIEGVNVTVPFKNKVVRFMDDLTKEAKESMSVNTIYLKEYIIKI